MYCRRCGAPNPDWAPACASCAAPLVPAFMPPPAPLAPAGLRGSTHLVYAILATVLFCMPFGVVGIVFASQIDGKVAAGDIVGAESSARQAKGWTIAAFALGGVVGLAYVALLVAGLVLDK